MGILDYKVEYDCTSLGNCKVRSDYGLIEKELTTIFKLYITFFARSTLKQIYFIFMKSHY